MLTPNWRLRASNTQNQNVIVTATARYFKYATDGSILWSTEQTLISAQGIGATTGTFASAPVNNSTDKWLGMEMTVLFLASTTTNGTGAVTLTLETSTDGGTTWPTQDLGRFVGAYTVTATDATNARRRNFLVR